MSVSKSTNTNTNDQPYEQSDFLRFHEARKDTSTTIPDSPVEDVQIDQASSDLKNIVVKTIILNILKNRSSIRKSSEESLGNTAAPILAMRSSGDHSETNNVRKLEIEKLQRANKDKMEVIEENLKQIQRHGCRVPAQNERNKRDNSQPGIVQKERHLKSPLVTNQKSDIKQKQIGSNRTCEEKKTNGNNNNSNSTSSTLGPYITVNGIQQGGQTKDMTESMKPQSKVKFSESHRF
ncbi:hypothetical protein M8J76_014741 [Diaphorina citri]|nr:hypothetical protein M8J75_003357 [Diaphorina citri]KAI5733690.1 hypothetical protein M8J76_014741 [Diaphorina citri]